jgi:hypothetical protein
MRGHAAEANMPRAEKIVTGLATAVLIVGFATGIFVKSVNMSMHEPTVTVHAQTPQVHHHRR